MKNMLYAFLIPLLLGATACGGEVTDYDTTEQEVELSASVSSVSFDSMGGEKTFTVTSATQPTVRADGGWLSAKADKISRKKETVITLILLLPILFLRVS